MAQNTLEKKNVGEKSSREVERLQVCYKKHDTQRRVAAAGERAR